MDNYEENNSTNVMQLITLIVSDLTRLKDLKIPIKTFMYPEAEEMFTTIIELYKQNGFVSNVELAKLSKDGKFNWGLYCEYSLGSVLDTKMMNTSYLQQMFFYQNKILEHYKITKISKLTDDLQTKKIGYDEFMEKIKVINDYRIEQVTTNFKTISEIPFQEEEKTYINSNVWKLDNAIKGFALGELSIWSGGNASSKSTFLNQMALETITQGYNVAIYSGELTNVRLLKWIFLQACGKKKIIEKNGFYSPREMERDKISFWLNDKLFIFDDKCGNKINIILESVRNIVEKKDVKVVIIDNLMSMEFDSKENKYDAQSNLVKELSKLAKELNIHIHFVCHPRKSMNFLRKNDISGTADITNLADNVFIMHRTNNDFTRTTKEMFGWSDDYEIYKYSNVVEICKNREFGVQDLFVGLHFEIESKRLLNIPTEEKHYGWEMMR